MRKNEGCQLLWKAEEASITKLEEERKMEKNESESNSLGRNK